MDLCGTARASCGIKTMHIFTLMAVIEALKRHSVSQPLFCRLAAARKGPTSGIRPASHGLKKAPVPHGTTGAVETPREEPGWLPERKSAGTKQGMPWKWVGSAFPVSLPSSPEAPAAAATRLCAPGKRNTLLSALIFTPGQTPFCAQMIYGRRGRGLTRCEPALVTASRLS